MPKKIFVSYAREDLKTAKKLHTDLKAHGFDPWLDEENLLAGENWRDLPALRRWQAALLAPLVETRLSPDPGVP